MRVQGRELYIQSSQYMGSYAVTNAKADVHCENDVLAGFIHEVSRADLPAAPVCMYA